MFKGNFTSIDFCRRLNFSAHNGLQKSKITRLYLLIFLLLTDRRFWNIDSAAWLIARDKRFDVVLTLGHESDAPLPNLLTYKSEVSKPCFFYTRISCKYVGRFTGTGDRCVCPLSRAVKSVTLNSKYVFIIS